MAKQKIKIDPLTQAKQAVQMFEQMQNALEFLNTQVRDMLEFNLAHARKQVSNLEAKENQLLDEADSQLKAFS